MGLSLVFVGLHWLFVAVVGLGWPLLAVVGLHWPSGSVLVVVGSAGGEMSLVYCINE